MLVADLVTRALRRLGVVAADEPATADQIDNGVNTLNDMLHSWAARGVNLAHVDYAPSDRMRTARSLDLHIQRLLQSELMEYGVPNPDANEADHSWRVIQAAYWVSDDTVASFDGALTETPTKRLRGRIYVG